MVLEDAMNSLKSMLANQSVRVYDHKLKNITSSGRELKQVLSDMGGYLPVATPHIISCIYSLPSGVTPSDQTFHISTGTEGPIVGLVITMALGTTDTPRLLDISIQAQNNTRGSGYNVLMDHIKCDFFPVKPELVVLFTRVNGKNANCFCSADIVDLVIHTSSGLRDGDLVKVETIDVGHPYYEQYLAERL